MAPPPAQAQDKPRVGKIAIELDALKAPMFPVKRQRPWSVYALLAALLAAVIAALLWWFFH
jgi:hypothetical protein